MNRIEHIDDKELAAQQKELNLEGEDGYYRETLGWLEINNGYMFFAD